jgi:hypothetical protein
MASAASDSENKEENTKSRRQGFPSQRSVRSDLLVRAKRLSVSAATHRSPDDRRLFPESERKRAIATPGYQNSVALFRRAAAIDAGSSYDAAWHRLCTVIHGSVPRLRKNEGFTRFPRFRSAQEVQQ